MRAAEIEGTYTVRKQGMIILPILATALAVFGILAVYSASYYTAEQQTGDSFFYMKKQVVGVLLGIGAMAATAFFPYRKLKKLKWVAVAVSVVLLLAVFIPGIGVENYGAKRWIGIGPITVQPSEIAKYGFVLFAASYISDRPQRMLTFKGLLPVLAVGGIICVLVLAEPNMSVTMCIGMILLTMLFLGGIRWKHLTAILLPIAAAVPVLIIMEPYRLQRLYAFLDPWRSPQGEGYQLIQSLYALGNGGWLGVGLFHSVQKYRYLPFAESDFILSVIGEEFGFVGIVLLFFVFALFICFGIQTAAKSKDMFGYLAASGITTAIAIQTCINACVVSGMIPPTGIPLPFISAGNTSLIFTMAAVGVLYNISKS